MKWKDIIKQEWEIRPCWSGTDCWCRRICTKSGTEIVDGARIRKEVASYFVAIHNAKLRNNKVNMKKFENIIFYDCEDIGYKNQLNKRWKVKRCGVKSCNCRIIKSSYGMFVSNIYIIVEGSLNKEEATYFVKLHNTFLKENKVAMSKKRKKALATERSRASNLKNAKDNFGQEKKKRKGKK